MMAPMGIFCFADGEWASWSGKDRLCRTQTCLGHTGEVQAGVMSLDCGVPLPKMAPEGWDGRIGCASCCPHSSEGISCAYATGCGVHSAF